MIAIHNAENWLGMDGDSELSMFNKEGNGNGNKKLMLDGTDDIVVPQPKSKFESWTVLHKKLNNFIRKHGGTLTCHQIPTP